MQKQSNTIQQNQSGLLSRNISVCANSLRAHTACVPLHSDADSSLLNPPLRIRIQALNSLGAGPFSHTFKMKTKPLPPQPPRLECTAFSHQTLRLKWGDGPAKASTSDALQYQLQMEDKSGRSVACYSGEGK